MKSPLAEIGMALSDDTRLTVLRALGKGPLCVSRLAALFTPAMSQPAMSHHLKTLRQAGLVEMDRRGKFNFYGRTARAAELLAAAERILARGEK